MRTQLYALGTFSDMHSKKNVRIFQRSKERHPKFDCLSHKYLKSYAVKKLACCVYRLLRFSHRIGLFTLTRWVYKMVEANILQDSCDGCNFSLGPAAAYISYKNTGFQLPMCQFAPKFVLERDQTSNMAEI